MKNKKEFLIDTDVLVDHLIHDKNSKSDLEKAMLKGTCFTTVINASELYLAANVSERKWIDKLLRTINVLGLHARYSLSASNYCGRTENLREVLLVITAKINKLPLLTNNKEKYKFADIELIDSKSL